MTDRGGNCPQYNTHHPAPKTQRRWLEREVKLISVGERECFDYGEYEDQNDCPLCCVVTKYVLVIILVCFFVIIPTVMIYVGVAYRYCDDIFPAWLIAGRAPEVTYQASSNALKLYKHDSSI